MREYVHSFQDGGVSYINLSNEFKTEWQSHIQNLAQKSFMQTPYSVKQMDSGMCLTGKMAPRVAG